MPGEAVNPGNQGSLMGHHRVCRPHGNISDATCKLGLVQCVDLAEVEGDPAVGSVFDEDGREVGQRSICLGWVEGCRVELVG